MRFFISICFVVFYTLLGISQKGKELGGWLGTSVYFGDLNTTFKLQKPGIAGGIVSRVNFDTRVSMVGSLSYGRISASDEKSTNNFEKNRNLSFRTDLVDFTFGTEFNFMNYYHGSKNAWYTPYVSAGVSVFYFNPKAKLNDEWYSLRPLGTEGQDQGAEYSTISGSIVLGAGFKFDINRDWSINIRYNMHQWLFTDYVDDVSTVFPEYVLLDRRRGPEAVALSNRSLVDGIGTPGRQRGNSRDNDKFAFFGVSLMRYFGGIECPRISEIKL